MQFSGTKPQSLTGLKISGKKSVRILTKLSISAAGETDISRHAILSPFQTYAPDISPQRNGVSPFLPPNPPRHLFQKTEETEFRTCSDSLLFTFNAHRFQPNLNYA